MFVHIDGRIVHGIRIFHVSDDPQEKISKNSHCICTISGSGLRDILVQSNEGSFTIEMALVIPLMLAMMCLILQVVLYAHDTVWVDAWICTINQERCWQEEEVPLPKLMVLRQKNVEQTVENNIATTQGVFQFALLPSYARTLVPDYPETVVRSVSDPVWDLPGWVRKMGAYLNQE